METAKKIEAKTIRDGINDMKDSLKRIGKQIDRVSRDMEAVQDHFHQSAGNVLRVLSKMKRNATKLQGVQASRSMDTVPGDVVSDTAVSPKSPKSVTFGDDEDELKRAESVPSKLRKFKIIDSEYKGSWTVRDRKERGQMSPEEGPPNIWHRQETLVDSDDDFDDESGGSPKGLRRRKTRMKKVKIKRLRRTKRKERGPVSAKTKRTIKRLRANKEAEELGAASDGKAGAMQKQQSRMAVK